MFRESNNIFFNINNDSLSKNKNEIESKHTRINNNSLNIHINDTKKILFGSDFPINNYWNKLLFNKSKSLSKEYKETCTILKDLNYE